MTANSPWTCIIAVGVTALCGCADINEQGRSNYQTKVAEAAQRCKIAFAAVDPIPEMQGIVHKLKIDSREYITPREKPVVDAMRQSVQECNEAQEDVYPGMYPAAATVYREYDKDRLGAFIKLRDGEFSFAEADSHLKQISLERDESLEKLPVTWQLKSRIGPMQVAAFGRA